MINKQIEALKMAIGLCEKSIKGLEGDENSGLCSVNDEGVFGDALREYYKLLQACKEALAEAEKQEKEAQQDAEAWIEQLNNEIKNDAAKLTLEEGRKIMRALEALKEKNASNN